MWICPKCGREFKKTNQSHYCGKAPTTVDEYIETQPIDIQDYLRQVRDVIRKTIPEAEERISWSMPTYYKGVNIIHFAANKKHIGLYVGMETVEEFKDKLQDYKYNKGTIQIPYSDELPLELIEDITRYCYENR